MSYKPHDFKANDTLFHYQLNEMDYQIAENENRIEILESFHKGDLTYQQIAEIVRKGQAEKYFSIGDQIIAKYTATNGTVYDMPFDVVAFRESELENGDIVPSMIIQSHYATLESVQFDAAEPNRPADKDYSGQIAQYGWNRWKASGQRQWLNSDAVKGEWWTAFDEYDVAPSQLGSINGFMRGFESDFLSMLKPVKIETCRNYRDYDTKKSSSVYEYDTTFDTFFLPSKEEEYTVVNEPNHREGTAWEYWIERLTPEAIEKGEPLPQQNYASADVQHILTSHIRYNLENHGSASTVRLRSANRYYSYYAWFVHSAGYVISYYAYGSYRSAPACAIC